MGEPGGGVVGEASASLTSCCDAVSGCTPLGPQGLSPRPACGPAHLTCKGRWWAAVTTFPASKGWLPREVPEVRPRPQGTPVHNKQVSARPVASHSTPPSC